MNNNIYSTHLYLSIKRYTFIFKRHNKIPVYIFVPQNVIYIYMLLIQYAIGRYRTLFIKIFLDLFMV